MPLLKNPVTVRTIIFASCNAGKRWSRKKKNEKMSSFVDRMLRLVSDRIKKEKLNNGHTPEIFGANGFHMNAFMMEYTYIRVHSQYKTDAAKAMTDKQYALITPHTWGALSSQFRFAMSPTGERGYLQADLSKTSAAEEEDDEEEEVDDETPADDLDAED